MKIAPVFYSLRAWRKLKGVLQSWLQTSGKDEVMGKNAICQELKDVRTQDTFVTVYVEHKLTLFAVILA